MKIGISIALSGAVLLLVGLAAFGQGIDFDPNTYNPAVGETVTFSVCASCTAGAVSYEWDFNGDGIPDLSTADPSVERAFGSPGYHVVTLRVVGSDGRVTMRKKGIIVGHSPLIGIRHVEPGPNGSLSVTIKVIAGADLSGVGIEETIPLGWQVSATQTGGVFVKRAGRTLQVLWLNQLTDGDAVTFSYTLYPTQGNGIPSFAGTISGYNSGKRTKNDLCGDLTMPQ